MYGVDLSIAAVRLLGCCRGMLMGLILPSLSAATIATVQVDGCRIVQLGVPCHDGFTALLLGMQLCLRFHILAMHTGSAVSFRMK